MVRPARPTFTGLLVAAATVAAAADAPPPPGWYSKSGLSFVMTSGNSGTSALGAKVAAPETLNMELVLCVGSRATPKVLAPPTFRLAAPTVGAILRKSRLFICDKSGNRR